jgi:hypothetical protein
MGEGGLRRGGLGECSEEAQDAHSGGRIVDAVVVDDVVTTTEAVQFHCRASAESISLQR